MSRFRVALGLAVLTLSRSWFFLVSILPPIAVLSLTGLLAVGAASSDNIDVAQFAGFGYVVAGASFLFLVLLADILGVIAVKRDIRDRSAKMILCRPVSFHQWLSSRFLAGALVLTFAAATNGLAVWTCLRVLEFETGGNIMIAFALTYAALLALYAYAFFLSTWMHETVAGFLALLVNGPLFRGIATMVLMVHQMLTASNATYTLESAVAAMRGIYVILPDTFQPTSLFNLLNLAPTNFPFDATFRAAAPWSLLYALDLVIIFYALAAVILRRRNLT